MGTNKSHQFEVTCITKLAESRRSGAGDWAVLTGYSSSLEAVILRPDNRLVLPIHLTGRKIGILTDRQIKPIIIIAGG